MNPINCNKCSREYHNQGRAFQRHIIKCDGRYRRNYKVWNHGIKTSVCEYCGRQGKNLTSNVQHQLRCPKNPNGPTITPFYEKLRSEGRMEELSEFKRRASEHTSRIAKNYWSNPENKVKHREVMKAAVLSNPESYSKSNRGRTKVIIKDGIRFNGNWEVLFYDWCVKSSVTIQRCTEWFTYEYKGTRNYNPDFYLPAMDLYVEIKGFQTERDEAKWRDFPHQLAVINKEHIKSINDGSFSAESILQLKW